MINRIAQYTGIFACIGIIAACFMPWTYYHNIRETFTGFYVVPFPSGNYYGKAGIPITILASLILIGMFVRKLWAKRINLFLGALLLSYTVRTFIIFTSALFKEEVVSYAGIYLIIIFSVLILICSLFPSQNKNTLHQSMPGKTDSK